MTQEEYWGIQRREWKTTRIGSWSVQGAARIEIDDTKGRCIPLYVVYSGMGMVWLGVVCIIPIQGDGILARGLPDHE